jgi:alpha-glucosidase
MRWAEMNAFTSAYRTHEGNNPEVSHQFYSDEETLEFFSRFAKVFALLADYRDILFHEAATKGYPVSRHPLLHYPSDPVAHSLKTQFMLGADFMVAPVTDPGLSTMEVYLPAGEWVHIWSGKSFGNLESGTWVHIDCPIGQPPVFFKSDSTYGWNFYNQL